MKYCVVEDQKFKCANLTYVCLTALACQAIECFG